MKKFTLMLFLAIAVSVAGFAQSRYIEVQVSDTITLKPVAITYSISPGKNTPSYIINGEDAPVTETEVLASAKDIEAALKKNKITYKTLYQKDGNALLNKDSSIMVEVKTVNEVNKLKEITASLNGAEGQVSDIKYESWGKYKETLYKNLFQKAQQDANLLASISGNSIVRLLSVEENKQMDLTGGMEEYAGLLGPISKIFTALTASGSDNYQKDYVRKLLFKFEIK